MIITESDLKLIENQLTKSLVVESDGKLTEFQAERLSRSLIKNVDFSNSTLAHKGLNWFAKEILNKLEL